MGEGRRITRQKMSQVYIPIRPAEFGGSFNYFATTSFLLASRMKARKEA